MVSIRCVIIGGISIKTLILKTCGLGLLSFAIVVSAGYHLARAQFTSQLAGTFSAAVTARQYQGLLLDTGGLGAVVTNVLNSSNVFHLDRIIIKPSSGQHFQRDYGNRGFSSLNLSVPRSDYEISATVRPRGGVLFVFVLFAILSGVLVGSIYYAVVSWNHKTAELAARRREADIAQQVAHDIRSPLQALQTVYVLTKSNLEPNLNGLFESSIERVQSIADDLGNPSKPIEKINLSNVLEELVREKQAEYVGRNIDVSLGKTNSKDLLVSGMPGDLKRMLSNIINNAAESYSDDGIVEIETKSYRKGALVTVRDKGKGIAKAQLKKLGTRGFTSGKKDGSGLGLYHAYTTLQILGGKLTVRSRPNLGTSVEIFLPREALPNN